MGRYKHTGLAHGTNGSPQKSLENDELEAKVKVLEEKVLLEKNKREKEQLERGIRELEKANVKFNKEDVVFVTRDRTGQLIWLEKGNQISGLEHLLKHKADFYNTARIKEDDIPKYLKKVITNGTLVKIKIKIINGKKGYEKVYKYDSKFYMIAAIGLNGFIVSAYPIKKL